MKSLKTISPGLLVLAMSPAFAAKAPDGGSATSGDYTSIPPAIITGADPLVIIDLSVELTQQAEAYTDGDVDYGGDPAFSCPDRLSGKGICYFENFEYIGYFDANKCYTYETKTDTTKSQQPQSPYTGSSSIYRGATANPTTLPNPSYFKPSSLANADHTCNGASEWSGNYMNWATMSAIDEFRFAMTGGARLIDTVGSNAQTLLTKNWDTSWGFVDKVVGRGSDKQTKSGQDFDTDIEKLTGLEVSYPSADLGKVTAKIEDNKGHRVTFYDKAGSSIAEFNVIVQVCDPTVSLESNCVEYSDGSDTWYKPEGQLQNNALKMRYALSSYLADNSHNRNGGVMRSLAKYIGYLQPAANGGLEINTAGEIAEDGRIVYNPEGVAITSAVKNSGIINYINNFGLGSNGYKAFDPVAELFYESLRYFKGLAPTPEYSSSLTDAMYDNFPVFNNAADWTASNPVNNACQETYKLYIGDQFAWEDNNLPNSSCVSHPTGGGEPSNIDADILACAMTDDVGTFEGFHSGSLGSQTRGRSNNGWWVAGLAHYANTEDLNSVFDGDQTIKTFMVDTAEYKTNPPAKQNNPLWLAAKYGGFDDLDGNDRPNTTNGDQTSNDEWDADNDGDPDTYTVANQPDNLIAGLNAAFTEISQNTSSSSAAAVISNSAGGTGAIYQALYDPRLVDSSTNEVVDWSGTLISFFIDDKSRFREDACDPALTSSDNCDKTLTNNDPEVRFRSDIVNGKKVVVFDRYDTSGGQLTTGHTLDEFDVIWDASTELSALTDSEATTQRSYGSTSDTGRYIFTWLDGLDDPSNVPDGNVDTNEVKAFDVNTFPAIDSSDSTYDERRLLGLDSSNEFAGATDLGAALINFIRGEDQAISGWRARSVGGVKKRMGDVVNSSPTVVGAPKEGYSFIYGDTEYAFFEQRYADRRQVAYVGGNDGMLHAFNAGFYDQASLSFKTSTPILSNETLHPLGGEIWSYVPYNLLPHLQWLKELDYPHVAYVDGDVQSFDVNIFDDCSNVNTCDHPYGWGTIIVATMRFGGGEITIDPNSDDSDGNAADDITMRSAIIIMDVTNPEKEPVLLAEISHEELGFTTSKPIVYKERPLDSNGNFTNSQWYLVFGSGPAGTTASAKENALLNAESNQEAKVFAFNLENKTWVDFDGGTSGVQGQGTAQSNSFVGDLAVMDWDQDFVDDAIYFGITGGTVSAPTGQLMRMVPSITFTPSTLLTNNNKPYTAAPTPYVDRRGYPWIYAGTGRFFVSDDILSTQQQSFHGIREPISGGSLTYASVDRRSLVDTTDIWVFEDGNVTTPAKTQPVPVASRDGGVNTTATTYSQVFSTVSESNGWDVELTTVESRNLLKSILIRGVVLFDEYIVSGDTCEPDGSSILYTLSTLSGTPSPDAVFALDTNETFNNNGNARVLGGIDMGDGKIIGLSGHKNSAVVGMGGDDGFKPKTKLGDFNAVGFGRRSWRELPVQ